MLILHCLVFVIVLDNFVTGLHFILGINYVYYLVVCNTRNCWFIYLLVEVVHHIFYYTGLCSHGQFNLLNGHCSIMEVESGFPTNFVSIP